MLEGNLYVDQMINYLESYKNIIGAPKIQNYFGVITLFFSSKYCFFATFLSFFFIAFCIYRSFSLLAIRLSLFFATAFKIDNYLFCRSQKSFKYIYRKQYRKVAMNQCIKQIQKIKQRDLKKKIYSAINNIGSNRERITI